MDENGEEGMKIENDEQKINKKEMKFSKKYCKFNNPIGSFLTISQAAYHIFT